MEYFDCRGFQQYLASEACSPPIAPGNWGGWFPVGTWTISCHHKSGSTESKKAYIVQNIRPKTIYSYILLFLEGTCVHFFGLFTELHVVQACKIVKHAELLPVLGIGCSSQAGDFLKDLAEFGNTKCYV